MSEKDTGFMISCKTAAEFVERKQEEKLGLKARFQLRIHLLLCKACKLYEQSSKQIDQMLKKYYEKKDAHNEEDINKLKENILKNTGR
jgi:hypothetical protein